jgi:hypothetical protein
MIHRLKTYWRRVLGTERHSNDGYGQSLADDARSAIRFRKLSKQDLVWGPASDYPGNVAADFPILDRFGDGIFAYRAAAEEQWFIIDRLWHGFPDPPEFAFLAFDASKQIVTGKDFSTWPATWKRPSPAGGVSLDPTEA